MENHKKKYQALKSLSKEMMKIGNVTEYYKLLNELLVIKSQLVRLNLP